MKRLGQTMAFIGLVLLAGPALAAEESPMAIDGATTIDAPTAKDLFERGIPFVDVRKDSDWEAGRVPGAYHLELKQVLSRERLSEVVATDGQVVIYCNGPGCMRSSEASAKAVSWGFENVMYFRDGFPAWKLAGYPVE